MPKTNFPTVETTSGAIEVYSPTARAFHWIVVAFIAVQIPAGLYMAYRGGDLNIWDATTNNLYSAHKLAGIVILLLVILRLGYRLTAGAPHPEPTLEPWQKMVSEITHWALYGLLLVVPILGYIGVSMYPALDIFGLFSLPAIAAKDQKFSETIFELHAIGAFALLGLIAMHIGAALYHHTVRKDNVLGRMLSSALRKTR